MEKKRRYLRKYLSGQLILTTSVYFLRESQRKKKISEHDYFYLWGGNEIKSLTENFSFSGANGKIDAVGRVYFSIFKEGKIPLYFVEGEYGGLSLSFRSVGDVLPPSSGKGEKKHILQFSKKGAHGHSIRGSPKHREKRYKIFYEFFERKLKKYEEGFDLDKILGGKNKE